MSEPTPGPWEFVPGDEYHGPYVTSEFGSTICDCYTMTEPGPLSFERKRRPVPFLHEMAEPNARLIAAAPDMLAALRNVRALISEAAMTGFNCKDGDWAERLFLSQQTTSRAIDKAVSKSTTRLMELLPSPENGNPGDGNPPL
jgi:hypothetical protein